MDILYSFQQNKLLNFLIAGYIEFYYLIKNIDGDFVFSKWKIDKMYNQKKKETDP